MYVPLLKIRLPNGWRLRYCVYFISMEAYAAVCFRYISSPFFILFQSLMQSVEISSGERNVMADVNLENSNHLTIFPSISIHSTLDTSVTPTICPSLSTIGSLGISFSEI
jgi:hypothetical protein